MFHVEAYVCLYMHVHMNKNFAFLEKDSIFSIPIAAFHPRCFYQNYQYI